MQTKTFMKVIIGLQAAIIIIILVHEQQRRTLWNNDSAARGALEQRAKDVEELRQKPEALYADLIDRIKDLQGRATQLQIATSESERTTALVAETNARVARIEQMIEKLNR